MLISEDEKLFEEVEKKFKERKVYDDKPESADILFLKAEIALHRGFNMINPGQELSAVFAIKSAYNLQAEWLSKNTPTSSPSKNEWLIGSDGGLWCPINITGSFSLLGMKGSVAVGQKQLNDLRNSTVSLNKEASIIYFAVKGWSISKLMKLQKSRRPRWKPIRTIGWWCFWPSIWWWKNSQSEEAYKLVQRLDAVNQGLRCLHWIFAWWNIDAENQYDAAIAAYQKFIRIYKADSFKKMPR